MCREEAGQLAALLPLLKAEGRTPNLVGVVHEDLGVAEFRGFFPGGRVFLDQQRRLFEALGSRWLGGSGFLRPSVWRNVVRAKLSGVQGNSEGEGRLLGGVVVIGPGEQGVLYVHKEEVWGDHAPVDEVLAACRRMKIANAPAS